MKNFSWKKYIVYLLLTLIILPSIVLNIYYIPKYYKEKQNYYEGTYTVTILGQKEDYSIYFTKGLSVKSTDNSLGAVLSKYPDDFGLVKGAYGNFLNRVGKITLADSTKAYFNIQSGNNNQKDADNIHPDCNQYENNVCSQGVDNLKLLPKTENVFRFVITKL